MKYESNAEYCRRKADQHYEMAGLARMDNDKVDELRHLKLAKAWEDEMNIYRERDLELAGPPISLEQMLRQCLE